MDRPWTSRRRWPRYPFVPTVAGDGRKLESAETEGLTGRRVAARFSAVASEGGGARDAPSHLKAAASFDREYERSRRPLNRSSARLPLHPDGEDWRWKDRPVDLDRVGDRGRPRRSAEARNKERPRRLGEKERP
jgi:hypothetical protein